MLGLQGKSAKPAPRAAPFSKPAKVPVSTMAASGGNGNKSRASSSACEKPERLSLTSRGPSPYSSKLTTTGVSSGSTTGRRVQSAATTRQKSALGGPTIKASELFRKNHSEPQLAKGSNNNGKPGTTNINIPGGKTSNAKTVKHVRIDTEHESLKTTLNTAANLLGIYDSAEFNQGDCGGGGGTIGGGPNRRRPFSFSSNRTRSVSVASNDSCSIFENESMTDGGGGGDVYWGKEQENNNNKRGISSISNKNSDTCSTVSSDSQRSVVSTGGKGNPPLNKRSYSMDACEMDSDQDDNFWNSSPPPAEKFQPQRIEIKIAEHPEETLKEENLTFRGIGQSSARGNFTRAFTEDGSGDAFKLHKVQGASSNQKGKSDFDRLLFKQSDDLLQGVSDLINEIKSTETSKKLIKSSSLSIFQDDNNSVEIEKLVADLRNDMNKQKMYDSTAFSLEKKDDIPEQRRQDYRMVDDRLNFSTLTISGTELSDITCPTQVMEQSESVPNTGRIERPFSAVVLGNDNENNVSSDIISEAETYLLMNRERIGQKAESFKNNNNNGGSSDGFDEFSSDSNNQTFPSSEALSIIEQQRVSSARSHSMERGKESARASSSTSQQHGENELSQEEIQQKIRSALQLLEEEDKKFRIVNSTRKGKMPLRHDADIRSRSPYACVSDPDSRPASVGGMDSEDSSKSFPRIQSDDRNIHYDNYDERHPVRHPSGGSAVTRSNELRRGVSLLDPPQSARSCSCILDHVSNEPLNSARSSKTTAGVIYQSSSDVGRHNKKAGLQRAGSTSDNMWETKDDKTKQIFSFLDEVEKSDQEMLFGLRFETDCLGRPKATSSTALGIGMSTNDSSVNRPMIGKPGSNDEKQLRSMDSLIRKGSVELAREILMLERKLEEAQHSIKLLEESLLTQRDLNIRTLRNTERDFKKRMKMQKEEFDQVFARNEALINEMATEKRVLQDKFDKLIKNFEEMDEKHKEHVKSMQQKHLDEIRRLRKMQQNAENSLKKNIAGNKVQANEIREMTVKGLEPEVQRIIQRHQQEMSEMRAWHSDEVREIEERYQRKIHMQLEDMRQKFAKEKEDLAIKERELANRRMQAELKQRDDEIESLKRRHTNELFEERERAVAEETKLKESIQESVRKAQIKAELELEHLKQEYETKLANLERRHESEIKSIKDVYEAERQNWATNQVKKLEQALAEQEIRLKETFHAEKEREWREKERKLKEEFEKFRKEDEMSSESRFRRMQEKFQSELGEMEKIEKDVKAKFSQAKTDLLAKEEEVFSLKTSLNMKDKQLGDLQEANMKMQEERVNLTSVIRREFTDQIQAVEEECRSLKASIVEVQSNAKLQLEQKQLEIEKHIAEKEAEIEKIGLRVKQALARKDETILELQKQYEKSTFEIRHLEEMLEEQRKEFLHGMTKMSTSGGGRGQKK